MDMSSQDRIHVVTQYTRVHEHDVHKNKNATWSLFTLSEEIKI